MEPENFDWNNINSVFVEDMTYENINAPKWVDLSDPDEYLVDNDEAWFCKPDCRHPKTAGYFVKPMRNSKVKFLRTITISEIFPFREWNRRDAKIKEADVNSSYAEQNIDPDPLKTKGSNASKKFNEDGENKDPNLNRPPLHNKTKVKKVLAKTSTMKKKEPGNVLENSTQHHQTPKLRSTFSARNLFAGRYVLNQITEFCNELKKLGSRGSKKGSSSEEFTLGISGDLNERFGDRERLPLLQIQGKGVLKSKRTEETWQGA